MDLLEGMVGPFSGTANRSAWLGRLFAGKKLHTAYIGLVTGIHLTCLFRQVRLRWNLAKITTKDRDHGHVT